MTDDSQIARVEAAAKALSENNHAIHAMRRYRELARIALSAADAVQDRPNPDDRSGDVRSDNVEEFLAELDAPDPVVEGDENRQASDALSHALQAEVARLRERAEAAEARVGQLTQALTNEQRENDELCDETASLRVRCGELEAALREQEEVSVMLGNAMEVVAQHEHVALSRFARQTLDRLAALSAAGEAGDQ